MDVPSSWVPGGDVNLQVAWSQDVTSLLSASGITEFPATVNLEVNVAGADPDAQVWVGYYPSGQPLWGEAALVPGAMEIPEAMVDDTQALVVALTGDTSQAEVTVGASNPQGGSYASAPQGPTPSSNYTKPSSPPKTTVPKQAPAPKQATPSSSTDSTSIWLGMAAALAVAVALGWVEL